MRELVLNPNSLSTKLLYQPLINVLFLLQTFLPGHDLGVAIIALTLLIRLILFPSYLKMMINAQRLRGLEPQVKELRGRFKTDKKRETEEIMKLYKESGVNPAAGCLPLLIQLPIIFALYRIFAFGLNENSLSVLYSWFPNPPRTVDVSFLGLLDLTKPSFWLALLAALFQLWQGYLSLKSSLTPGKNLFVTLQTLLIFPAITLLIGMGVPAAAALYWATSTLVGAIQQWQIVFILRREDGRNTGS